MTLKPNTITVTRKAVKYILFQRTQYLFVHRNKLAKSFMNALPKKVAFPLESLITSFNAGVAIEGFLTRKKVEELFSLEMSQEFEQLLPYLPKSTKTILDIGSGVGGIDVLLGKHYKNDRPDICLIDRTEMPSKVYYSFKEKGCYYNSLPVTKDLLVKNDIPEKTIFIQEATNDNAISFDKKFNLVLSLISWGFHYPVSTYLDVVYEKMAHGGVLVIDVRKWQGGLELIQKKFGNAKVIYAGGKHDRVVATKM